MMASVPLLCCCFFSLFYLFEAQYDSLAFEGGYFPFPARCNRRNPLRPCRPGPLLHERPHDFTLQTAPVLNPNPPNRYIVVAPNLLRMDSEENIFLEAIGLTSPLLVVLRFYSYPEKIFELYQDSVTLNEANQYNTLKTVKVPSQYIPKGSKPYDFVYMKAEFGSHVVEKVIMVSFQAGYIFVQTDKPLFNPGDSVNYRAFVSTPTFKAFSSSISVEIQNPDGLPIHLVSRTFAQNGIFSENYKLSSNAVEGTWKILAKFDDFPINQFTSEFEVKKYVLPAFNLTLTPQKPYFGVDDKELVVGIKARYLYGEPVKGVAYVVFGIEVNKEKRRLPHTMNRIEDLSNAKAILTMDDIKKGFPNIKDVVGSSIYVKVSALTSSGSDLVEAEHSGITIVESPYKISFRGTPKYFKSGFPFAVMVRVTHHDGSPATNVPFKLSTQIDSQTITFHKGTSRVSVNMPKDMMVQTITAETQQSDLRAEHQAKHQMLVRPYSPFSQHSQNYLLLSTSHESTSVGKVLTLNFHLHNSMEFSRGAINHITYMVVNKGKIISTHRILLQMKLVIEEMLTVTSEMIPSFRIVAFYIMPWQGTAEVVADSIRVDVEDACVAGLKVESKGSDVMQPGSSFSFDIRGYPGAKVSLLAVDNAVFLLNSKNRLSQSKIWDVVEKADIGCTPGGGKNNMGIFDDAGLMFHANEAEVTVTRQGMQCPKESRRRRSVRMMERRTELEEQYKDKALRKCCQDGMKDILMDYTCKRRSTYVTEGGECTQAFLVCCARYRGEPLQQPERHEESFIVHTSTMEIPLLSSTNVMSEVLFFDAPPEHVLSVIQEEPMLARESASGALPDEEDEYEEDYSDVYVRSKFFETWLWTEVSLPPTADEHSTDGLVVYPMETVLPDSITEWGIVAISSSPVTGFCVADPFNVKSRRNFFVDLQLPRSVARNEQVEVKAVLHNYGNKHLKVLVVLIKTVDICSVAYTEDYKKEVSIGPQSSMAIPYTIIPLEVGELDLEVRAVVKDSFGQDGVKKVLHVVLEGVKKTKVQTIVLNPQLKGGQSGKQAVTVDTIKMENLVPNSVPETYINIRGNVLADTIDNVISDNSLGSLLRMPGGCVEQNLASITFPLIATRYLDKAREWESVGTERRLDAVKYIQKGYENQLAYVKKDNSYPPYRKEGSSTWITAYVVKVFAMAWSIININEQHLCGPLLYLLKEKQLFNGAFREDNAVYDTSLTGAMQGSEYTSTITAFVLIAMSEAKTVSQCQETTLEEKIGRATEYLKGQLPNLRRPYSVAISAYALALLGQDKSFLTSHLQRTASEGTHWPDSENPLFTLEATGYALLAYVKLGDTEQASSIFQWLNKMRRLGGGYGSTQSTMVVLQALSEYLIHKPPPADLSLSVDLSITGRRAVNWFFNPKTSYVARSAKAVLGQPFTVVASGKGEGILEVVTVYNELPDVENTNSCNGFELEVTVKESTDSTPSPDIEKSYRLDISLRALGQTAATMSVLDITLPTGFDPDINDLEKLTNSVDQYINNFEIVDGLSDRTSLIIHLFKVSRDDKETISFRLQQKFRVGLIQPSSVTVFEYYNPERTCTRFYTPLEEKRELQRICTEETCRCSEGNCCILKTPNPSVDSVTRSDATCKGIYYAYRVKVLKVTQSQYDKYEVDIQQVIKEGKDMGIKVGQRRIFLSHAACREGLKLQEGDQYLIIGPPEDLWKTDASTNSVTYVFGKSTWVERWPTEAECKSVITVKRICAHLEKFAQDMSEIGCQT